MVKMKRNLRTGGIYAVFELHGRWYYADLSRVYSNGEVNEFMVFPSDSEGKVKSWGEVNVQRTDSITEEAFLHCLEVFKQECPA